MPDNLPGLDTLVIIKVYLAPTIVNQIILEFSSRAQGGKQ